MLAYFSVASSTTSMVSGVNTVLASWGSGAFSDLIAIILSALFGMLVLSYVIKHLHK